MKNPLLQKISEKRKAKNLSIAALARILGISRPYLSRVEDGLAKPTPALLYRILCELDFTSDDHDEVNALNKSTSAKAAGIDFSPSSIADLIKKHLENGGFHLVPGAKNDEIIIKLTGGRDAVITIKERHHANPINPIN